MKTLEQVLAYEGGPNCNYIDGRDKSRLVDFFPVSDWEKLGFKPADGFDVSKHTPAPLTEEVVKEKLKSDLMFAFEKALNQRGISSSLMHDVILMWLWVLDDNELHSKHTGGALYGQYGIPLYVDVARKYGFECPIGQDTGSEDKYASH